MGLRYRPRCPAHALHPAADKNLSLAGNNRLRGLIDRFQTGGAVTIHGDTANFHGESCQQESHAGHVAIIFPRLVAAAGINILH